MVQRRSSSLYAKAWSSCREMKLFYSCPIVNQVTVLCDMIYGALEQALQSFAIVDGVLAKITDTAGI